MLKRLFWFSFFTTHCIDQIKGLLRLLTSTGRKGYDAGSRMTISRLDSSIVYDAMTSRVALFARMLKLSCVPTEP